MLIAETFGNREKFNKFTLESIVDYILMNWKHFGTNEIGLAFELWSLNKLESIEMYGGEINLLFVNRLLTAYQGYRNKILKEYTEIMDKEKWEQEQAAKRAEEISKLDKMFDHEIRHEVEKCERWDQVPKWVLDQIAKRKMLRVSKEIQAETKERAKKIVQAECEAEAVEHKVNFRAYMDQLEKTIEAREHLTYCRLITFENL